MERQLVVWCPGLFEQQEHGREARAFAQVSRTLGEFSPRIEMLRPGVCSLCTRGPSRYFGGDQELAHLVSRALAGLEDLGGEQRLAVPDMTAGVGVADGLFAASLAARSALDDPNRAPVIVVPGATPGFLSPWPVTVLGRPELADLLCRLGVRTLGAFAELPPRHVLARFGTDGATCRAVAAGAEGELPGLRSLPRLARRTTGAGPVAPGTPARQAGFFGGTAGAEARAAKAVAVVQQLLHPEAVVRGRLQGGRGPAERACLVRWDARGEGRSTEAGRSPSGSGATSHPADPVRVQTGGETFPRKRVDTESAGESTLRQEKIPRKRAGGQAGAQDASLVGGAPWPGQVPAPSPIVVLGKALRAELLDAAGRPVGVSNRGIASADPSRLSMAGDLWSEVTGWAGPWPSDERWWSKRGRSRKARMQVVTTGGAAYLLTCRDGWWVEGIYD